MLKSPPSLKKRAAAFFFVTIVVSLSFGGYLVHFFSEQFRHDIGTRNFDLAHHIKEHVSVFLEHHVAELQELRLGIIQHGLTEYGYMREELDHINAFHPLLELVQVLDSNGYVLQVSPYSREFVDIDLSGHPSFKEAMEMSGLEVHWSDSFISPRTNDPAVTISLPLPLKDGVLMAHLNLRELSKVVASSGPAERETIVITDRHGVVIAHPDQNQVSQAVSFKDLPSIRSALNGKIGSFSETWQGIKGLSSVTTLENSDWVVAVFQPDSQSLGIMYSARNVVIASILSLLAVTVGAFLVFQRMGMRPFHKMEKRADMISAGNYGEDLDGEYKELSGFVSSFNRMARSVKAREEDLSSSEERFRNLFDEAADAVFILDETGKVMRVNREAHKSLGYTIDELVGINASNFVEGLVDEDVQADVASIEEGKTVTFEGRHRRKDGSIFPVETLMARMTGMVGGGVIAYVRDISARIQAESDVRKREKQYRLLADNAIDVIWTVDMELKYTYVSPSVERFRGLTIQEVLASTFDQAVTDDSAALTREILRQELEKEKDPGSDPNRSRTFEIQFHRKGGSLVWGEVTCAFLRNDNSEIIGIQGVTRDITERKKAEKALKSSEERFRSTFMTSPDAMVLNRLSDGVYVDFNEGFTELTGWKRKEALGKTAIQLGISVDPDKRREIAEMILTTGKVMNEEVFVGTKSGELIPCLLSASTIHLDGEPYLITITRNISELRKTESALKESNEILTAVIESSPLAIIRVGQEGIITMWNPAAERIFGWTAEETVGQFLPQVPEEKRGEALENIRTSLAGEIIAGFEAVRMKKDGSLVHVRFSSTSLATEDKGLEVLSVLEDISDRKAAEAALLESEGKFRAVFESSPMGILVYTLEPDDRLVFTDANPAAGKILGTGTDEYVGKTIEEAFPPLAESEIPDRYREVCRTGVSWHTSQVDYRDNLIAGAYEVYAFRTEPDTVAVLFMEITARLKAERSLKESEERLRKISEGVQEGVVITEKGVIVEANEQFAHILGWNPEEMVGKRVLEFVHPDSRKLVKEKISAGEEGQYEHDSVKKDGAVIRTQVKGSNTTYKGRPARVTSIVDITEIRRAEAVLREREKRYRQLYENNPLGYQSLNENGVVLEVNTAWLNLMGYDKEEALGREFRDFVTPESRVALSKNFPRLLERGEIQVPEIVLKNKDGNDVFIALFGRASFDEDLGMMRTHCLIQDITDRKKMESALQKSAQLAAVGQVASGIAHEINNPLATISASTEALLARIPELRKGKDGAVIDIYEDYLNMTKEEVERSGKIMRDLLDFARMRDYTLRPVNMRELITDTVKLFSIQSRMDKYNFILSQGRSKSIIPGDRDRLRQVLVILLSNAVESMPEGGTVELKGSMDRKKEVYRLTVRDEGPGFSPEDMEKTFEPFYTTKGSKGGTGLGLSIAETIVLKHGGKIEANNHKKGGAVMTMTLPLVSRDESEESGEDKIRETAHE